MNNVTLTYQDTIADDRFANAVGKLSAPELAVSGTSYGISGVTSLGLGGVYEKKGNYGALKVNKATGAYVFTPNDFAIEGLKTGATETFVVTAYNSGTQVQANVVINLSAVNDTVVVSNNQAKMVESVNAKTSGKIKLTDRDDLLGNAPVVAQTNVSTVYGFFSIKTNGEWSYILDTNNATAMSLNRGENLTEVIAITTALSGETVSLTLDILGQGGFGTVGKDALIGNQFDETLISYDGDDLLDGGAGSDTLIGGRGDDTYVIDNESDVITELTNEGLDNIQLKISSPTMIYDLLVNAPAVEYVSIVNEVALDISGNDLNNIIKGNSQANVLLGLLGNDTLNAGEGDDSLEGGDGEDVLRGEAGVDTLVGGVGNDAYYSSLVRDSLTNVISIEDSVIELSGEGTDSLTLGYVNSLGQHYTTQTITLPDYIENLSVLISGYTKTSNYVIFEGNNLDNQMVGDASANTLLGEDGQDSLYGGAGQDSLVGGEGNDLLSGQASIDTLYGGLGNDILYGGSENDQLFGEDEDDQLYGDTGNDDLDTGLGDNIASGGAGSDIIYASTGNDHLTGDDGNDLIFAGAGDDTIDGGNGSDIIQADAGDDTIYVGNGKEIISGGTGDDQFIFNQKLIMSVFRSNTDSFSLDFTTKDLYEYSVLSSLDYKYYNIGQLSLFGTSYDLFYSQVSGGVTYEYSKLKPFKAYFNNSVITDFVSGEDALSFDSLAFSALTDLSTQFRSGVVDTASNSQDRLIYNKSTGNLFYDADGTGKGLAYHLVTLQGKPDLILSDMSLV